MVDEAYTHLSEAPFNTDLVAKEKDVVVLRTFSKYRMGWLELCAAKRGPGAVRIWMRENREATATP